MEEHNPAMFYEDLARSVFEIRGMTCEKAGDPFHYAAQEIYVTYNTKDELSRSDSVIKKSLFLIISKIALDNHATRYEPNGLEKYVARLVDLGEKVWLIEDPKRIFEMVKDIRGVYDEIGRHKRRLL